MLRPQAGRSEKGRPAHVGPAGDAAEPGNRVHRRFHVRKDHRQGPDGPREVRGLLGPGDRGLRGISEVRRTPPPRLARRNGEGALPPRPPWSSAACSPPPQAGEGRVVAPVRFKRSVVLPPSRARASGTVAINLTRTQTDSSTL